MPSPYQKYLETIAVLSDGNPSREALESAIDALRSLARQAHTGDTTAYRDYQELCYDLHYAIDEPNYWLRQWLASTVYNLEISYIDLDPEFERLSTDDFSAKLTAEQQHLSPMQHPLFIFLFQGQPSFEQAKIYFYQKWLIRLTFWRSLAEFGQRLQRMDLENTALVYKNIFVELCEGNADEAHLSQHFRQLQHLGLDVSFTDQPEFPETKAYINFRLLCMRNEQPAWGLGSFYSMEATEPEYNIGHFNLLRRFNIAEQYCEVYRTDEDNNADHTDEILTVINNLLTTAEAQRICLAAQRQQMRLWHHHFDRVWQLVQDKTN